MPFQNTTSFSIDQRSPVSKLDVDAAYEIVTSLEADVLSLQKANANLHYYISHALGLIDTMQLGHNSDFGSLFRPKGALRQVSASARISFI